MQARGYRRWARRLLTLSLFVAVSTVAAEANLPLPKNTQLSIVGEDLSINGLQLRAYELRSELGIQDVLDFYAAAWPDQTRVAKLAPWTILSHPDGEYLVTVQLQAIPGGGSFGYVGITNLLKPELRLRRSDFPLPPGAELVSELEARDPRGRSHTVLLRNMASVEQSLAWFESYFRRDGWRRIADRRGGKSTLLMNKGQGELNLVAIRDGGQSVVTIVMVRPD